MKRDKTVHDEVVMEYTTEKGITVRVHDASYFGKTKEELARIEESAKLTAWWCAARASERDRISDRS